jgi:general secretion pathway protein E
VNPKIDLDFAKALRAILRQDPDVIMIGEIRDFETAQIAIQASLTGHLVLATLHTNDAVSAVTRLTDMGVEPFLLSSSLLGVLAQRLVRKLCTDCKQETAADTTKLGSDPDFAKRNSGSDPNFPAKNTSYHPVGCNSCGRSGYKGRTGIYELLTANDQVRALIHNRAAESQLFVAAEAAGLTSMRADGERLVRLGITSREELLRVTRD